MRSVGVCMVIQGFRPLMGGAEIQLERLLPHLEARGVSATVLTRAVASEPRSEAIAGGRIRRTRVAGRSPAASVSFVLGAFGYLVRRRRSVDLVHAHGAFSEGTIVLLARLLGLPGLVKVLRTGEQGDFEVLATKPLGKLRTRLLARTASFVALSDEAVEELRELGVRRDRIFEIPNGVDVAEFRPASDAARADLRRRLGLPDGPLAVYAGRLIEVKGVETVLRALPWVPQLSFLVVGEGPDEARLRQLARAHGIDGRTTFAGATRRVHDYLRAADFFVLPSRSEGMSNSLLEGMACGLACAATPVSGTAQLLADGRGLLVPAGDVAAWSDALARLAQDGALRAELGDRAAAHVRQHLSLEATADRLLEAYRRLTGRGGR